MSCAAADRAALGPVDAALLRPPLDVEALRPSSPRFDAVMRGEHSRCPPLTLAHQLLLLAALILHKALAARDAARHSHADSVP